MDPATAFSIAVGAIQLADYGIRVGRTCYEILRNSSGLSTDQNRIDEDAEHLQTLTTDLGNRLKTAPSPPGAGNTQEQEVLRAADACRNAAAELRDFISSLQLTGKKNVIRALRKAVHASSERKKVDELRARLQKNQSFLDTTLLSSILDKIDINDSKQREILKQVELTSIAHKDHQQQISQELLARLKDLTVGESRETRSLIRRCYDEYGDRRKLEEILSSLYFRSMTAREETVDENFKETFGWIFDESPDAVTPWDNLPRWLRRSPEESSPTISSIYWIAGKPGSGKSTLMNYVLNEPALRRNLEHWTSASPSSHLLILRHFFWRPGSPEQRSITGLLRSLIWQILKQVPHIAEAALTSTAVPTWTEKALIRELRRLMETFTRSDPPVYAFLLIDGLDELEGNLDRLLDLFQEMVSFPGVKMCAASRPESRIDERLAYCNKLRLHDLTKSDMRTFIQKSLYASPHMHRLLEETPKKAAFLIGEIFRNADGVFLWAKLVVDELVKGLRVRDTIDMLFERLRVASRGLDELFSQLLGRIESYHYQDSAWYLTCLLAARHNDENLNLLDFFLLKHTDSDILALLYDREDTDVTTLQASKALQQEFETLKTHLQARCAGLLTVEEDPCDIGIDNLQCTGCWQSNSQTLPTSGLFSHYFNHSTVRIVHRSALDFLRESDRADAFLKTSGTTMYTAHLALAKIPLRLPLYLNTAADYYGNMFSTVWFAAPFKQVELANRERNESFHKLVQRLLDINSTLESYLPAMYRIIANQWTLLFGRMIQIPSISIVKDIWRGKKVSLVVSRTNEELISVAVVPPGETSESNVGDVVKIPSPTADMKSNFISTVLLAGLLMDDVFFDSPNFSEEISKQLLSNGVDANESHYNGEEYVSLWTVFLGAIVLQFIQRKGPPWTRSNGLTLVETASMLANHIETFLSHNAEPKARLYEESSLYEQIPGTPIWSVTLSFTAGSVIRNLFSEYMDEVRFESIPRRQELEYSVRLPEFNLCLNMNKMDDSQLDDSQLAPMFNKISVPVDRQAGCEDTFEGLLFENRRLCSGDVEYDFLWNIWKIEMDRLVEAGELKREQLELVNVRIREEYKHPTPHVDELESSE
ncbi:MAG: hypothetical protein M1831_007031 [Alyxoria varia]|nr:MAG: hypothetical protein M1831_007031 [Alyxoria varia]